MFPNLKSKATTRGQPQEGNHKRATTRVAPTLHSAPHPHRQFLYRTEVSLGGYFGSFLPQTANFSLDIVYFKLLLLKVLHLFSKP